MKRPLNWMIPLAATAAKGPAVYKDIVAAFGAGEDHSLRNIFRSMLINGLIARLSTDDQGGSWDGDGRSVRYGITAEGARALDEFCATADKVREMMAK